MDSNIEHRVEALEDDIKHLERFDTIKRLIQRVGELDIHFARLTAAFEKEPNYAELVSRRWQELREIVQFISVVTHTDVLGNICAQMRQSKRELEKRIANEKREPNSLAGGESNDTSSAAAAAPEAKEDLPRSPAGMPTGGETPLA